MNTFTRTAVFPVTLCIAVVGGLWIQLLVWRQKVRNWHRTFMAGDPALPYGLTDNSPEINGDYGDVDEYGRTHREQRDAEKGEIAGDIERDGGL